MSSSKAYADSDSEDEFDEENAGSLLLGVPDGVIELGSDLVDPMVSRIGGSPCFPQPLSPDSKDAHCHVCALAMELIVQLWCPLEASPMDRVLYVFGCPRAGCQRRDGSVRAFRGLAYNTSYANTKAEKVPQKTPTADSVNPFTLSASGTSVFDVDFDNAIALHSVHERSDPKTQELAAQLDRISLSSTTPSCDAAWSNIPLYKPKYMATISEPSLTVSEVDNTKHATTEGGVETSWNAEAYEASQGIDRVFHQFSQRVSREPEQCIRYDLGGVPLPFQADKIFEQLFPVLSGSGRQFDGGAVSKCPKCGGKRVFECQLMPHIHSILQTESSRRSARSEEERREELRLLVGGLTAGVAPTERIGMEWGTCMVFSCEADCAGGESAKQGGSHWAEEFVLVQWDG